MRTDHFAYQQATRVASFGLFIQAGLGLLLLIFGLVENDTAFTLGSAYVLLGTVVWLSLTIVFNHHRLERLEALEADEAAAGTDGESVFREDEEAARVAARRLGLMHTWMMPLVSLGLAAALTGVGVYFLRWLREVDDVAGGLAHQVQIAEQLGWALALTLAAALISFIFSRFVAGMAKQAAWQNLRGGAAWMVGNALVLLALAVGIGFQFAQRTAVMEYVAIGIAIFMFAAAAEVLLNLILNLYRPRRVDEVPRAAFDSKLLSLLAAPDSIVRSINEAVNYQFGFDITSSWGYQLLLRSFASLIAIAAVVLLLMSCVVVVGPEQQGLRLRFGELVSVHEPGLMVKLPWPIETAQLHTVGRIQRLHVSLNPDEVRRDQSRVRVNFWVTEDPGASSRTLFITGASRLATEDPSLQAQVDRDLAREAALVGTEDEELARIGEQFALVDADVEIQYRVRRDALRQHVLFAGDAPTRRGGLTPRERSMRSIAAREVTDFLGRLNLEDVLSPGRSGVVDRLRLRIQERFDAPENDIGVEVVAVTLPMLRPPSEAAQTFEELSISIQARRELRDNAMRSAATTMAMLAGTTDDADRIVKRLLVYEAAVRDGDVERAADEQAEVERMLLEARGQPASRIAEAEATRWRAEMQARANASRLMGELRLFEIAPELYRQRRTMEVLSQRLPRARALFVVGLSPDRVHFDMQMQEADPGFNILDVIERDDEPAR